MSALKFSRRPMETYICSVLILWK